jgi:hypothetical protein
MQVRDAFSFDYPRASGPDNLLSNAPGRRLPLGIAASRLRTKPHRRRTKVEAAARGPHFPWRRANRMAPSAGAALESERSGLVPRRTSARKSAAAVGLRACSLRQSAPPTLDTFVGGIPEHRPPRRVITAAGLGGDRVAGKPKPVPALSLPTLGLRRPSPMHIGLRAA